MDKLRLILIMLLAGILLTKSNIETFNENNICRGKLSDYEYLNHMIPHHKVAIDISIMLQKITKSPVMHDILRKLIWTQETEIKLMKFALRELPNNYIINKNKYKKVYIPTVSDYILPNKVNLTTTYCDPDFFNPEEHMKHMKHMKLNDKMYIEHMIPHHQVAVDMSKVLLKNTKSDFMIYLAHRIIRSQQEEILILQDYLNSDYKLSSKLIN